MAKIEKILIITSADKDVDQTNLHALLMGIQDGLAI